MTSTQTRTTEVKKFHRVFEGTSQDDIRRQMDEFAKEFPECRRYLDNMFQEPDAPKQSTNVMKEIKVVASDDKDKISVEIDAEGFKIEDLSLKAVGRNMTIQACNETTEGDTTIRRELKRNVVLPEGVDVEKIKCRLTAEKKLVIEIPLPVEKPKGVEYIIPIRCAVARSTSKDGEKKA